MIFLPPIFCNSIIYFSIYQEQNYVNHSKCVQLDLWQNVALSFSFQMMPTAFPSSPFLSAAMSSPSGFRELSSNSNTFSVFYLLVRSGSAI